MTTYIFHASPDETGLTAGSQTRRSHDGQKARIVSPTGPADTMVEIAFEDGTHTIAHAHELEPKDEQHETRSFPFSFFLPPPIQVQWNGTTLEFSTPEATTWRRLHDLTQIENLARQRYRDTRDTAYNDELRTRGLNQEHAQ